jgi:hypothetical protein
MYGKIIDGVLEYAPKNFSLPNGQMIINFNRNENIMKKYGYKELVNQIPAYEPDTQDVYISKYVENDNNIIIVYEVCDIPVKESPTDIKIAELENRIFMLEEFENIYNTILSEEVNE